MGHWEVFVYLHYFLRGDHQIETAYWAEETPDTRRFQIFKTIFVQFPFEIWKNYIFEGI